MEGKAILVIGLGKLGIPLAVCFVGKRFRVVGVDVDPRRVDAVKRGAPLIYEPVTAELLAAADGRLTTTQDAEVAARESDVTFDGG